MTARAGICRQYGPPDTQRETLATKKKARTAYGKL